MRYELTDYEWAASSRSCRTTRGSRGTPPAKCVYSRQSEEKLFQHFDRNVM
jgi:hypothetical protein